VKISTGTKEDFILLDKTNLYYSTARYHDVLKYIRIRNYGYICGERQVEISMRGQQSPEKHLDQFSLTRLTRQNFAISSKSEIRAKVICNDNVTLITLPRHSHLTLPESCSIHSDTFIIYANEQKGLKEIYVSDHYNIEDIQPAMDAFNNKLINALSTAISVDPLTKREIENGGLSQRSISTLQTLHHIHAIAVSKGTESHKIWLIILTLIVIVTAAGTTLNCIVLAKKWITDTKRWKTVTREDKMIEMEVLFGELETQIATLEPRVVIYSQHSKDF
jgi:hypothetical protein